MNGAVRDVLRDAFAQLAKELIWRYAIRFQPRGTPICLYGSRRSGSSLLMEVIANNRGVMFSDQPFSAYTASRSNLNRLPLFPYGQIAYPDSDETNALRAYIVGLFSGTIRANLPWKVWSREFHHFNDRICLKITDAKHLIEWIDAEFDVHTVVLTRHPIAQALSVANVGWFPTGKGLLRNAGYVQRWLNSDLEAYCWEQYRCGEELTCRVTDWALENLPLLSLLRNHADWLFVGYEDLIRFPSAVVQSLADRLGLANHQQMLARIQLPSRSTSKLSTAERQRLIERGERSHLINSWRDKVSREQVARCFDVLAKFQIDVYTAEEDFPDPHRLGRERFE